jgi:spore coat protein U-like protein
MGVILALLSNGAEYAEAGCRVSTTSINFGNYDVFNNSNTTGTGSITLSCNEKTDVTIAIGHSSNSGGFYPRMMDHALLADTLDYNIYTDYGMNEVWGDNSNGTKIVRLKKVINQSVTIYGKIVPLQNVSVGSYSEHLFVTVEY